LESPKYIAIEGVIGAGKTSLAKKLAEKLSARLVFEEFEDNPFLEKFYDDRKTGQIMSRLVGDLREISEMAHHGPEDLFISAVMISVTFIYLLFLNWALTLVIFTFVLMQLWFSLTKRWKMREAFRSTRKEHASINAKIRSAADKPV